MNTIVRNPANTVALDVTSKFAIKSELFGPIANTSTPRQKTNANTNLAGFLYSGTVDNRYNPNNYDRNGSIRTTRNAPMLMNETRQAIGTNPSGSNNFRTLLTGTIFSSFQSDLVLLNSGTGISNGIGCTLQSKKIFRLRLGTILRAITRVKFVIGSANSIATIGFQRETTHGVSTATTDYTNDGCFWRMSNGTLTPIFISNGVQTDGTSITVNDQDFYLLEYILTTENVEMRIYNHDKTILLGEAKFTIPDTQLTIFPAVNNCLGFYYRVFNLASVALPTRLLVGETAIDIPDSSLESIRGAPNLYAINYLDGSVDHRSQNITHGYTNSADPSAGAALTNTTSSMPNARFGGEFLCALPAAANTDYNLFSWLVASNYDGFFLTDIMLTVRLINGTFGVNYTPHIMFVGLGINGSTSSLATSTNFRQTIGAIQLTPSNGPGFSSTNTSGYIGEIYKSFRTPLYVPAGRAFHVIIRLPNGNLNTVTTSIRGEVQCFGYFE